jgi:hypothetical protein
MTIVSLADVKTYIGLTGTQDDQLLTQLIGTAQARLERDTGRVFAYTSNTTSTYSTDGETLVRVRDMPANGSNTRTVRLSGVALVNGTSYWLLPDRRNPEVSTVLQLRAFDRSNPEWFKAFPGWWDANMDSPRCAAQLGSPNDLVINGPEGHPYPVPEDVVGMCKSMTALLYWQAKAGASGTVATPTGDLVDLSARDPVGYPEFVRDWRIRTAVSGV